MLTQEQFNAEIKQLRDEGKLAAIYTKSFDASKSPPATFADATYDQWKDVFHEMGPRQVYQSLVRPSQPYPCMIINVKPKDGVCRIQMGSTQHIDITKAITKAYEPIVFSILEKAGERVGEITRVDFPKEAQANHAAKQYIGDFAKLAETLHLPSLELSATNLGGYAWAKYGFTPDGQNAVESIRSCLRNPQGRGLSNRITPPKYQPDSKPPVLSYKDKQYELLPTEVLAINDIVNRDYPDIKEHFHRLTDLNRVLEEEDGKQLTVGKALMFGTRWKGSLPLDASSPHYQRFQNYVGEHGREVGKS